jgi:hypothetical protein
MIVRATFFWFTMSNNSVNVLRFNGPYRFHLQDLKGGQVRNEGVLIWFPDASARSLFDLPFDLEEEADMFL